MAKQKRYGKEFKHQAAELVVRQGHTKAEAARRLGVSANSIADWIRSLRKSGELDEDDVARRQADQCRDLRKRIRQLEMENEILRILANPATTVLWNHRGSANPFMRPGRKERGNVRWGNRLPTSITLPGQAYAAGVSRAP